MKIKQNERSSGSIAGVAAEVVAAPSDGAPMGFENIAEEGVELDPDGYVTVGQVAEIVRRALSEIRIYVLESDITDAQNSVKAIVQQSLF